MSGQPLGTWQEKLQFALAPFSTVLGKPFGAMATKPFRPPTTEPSFRPPTTEEKARGIYAYQPTRADVRAYEQWQAPGITIPGYEKLPSWMKYVIPERPDLKLLSEMFPDLPLYAIIPSATGLRVALRTGSAGAVEAAISEMFAKGLLPLAGLEQAPGFAVKQAVRGVKAAARAAKVSVAEAKLAPQKGAIKFPRGEKGWAQFEKAAQDVFSEIDAAKQRAGGDVALERDILENMRGKIENEIGLRSMPYHGRAKNAYPEYNTSQLQVIRNELLSAID